MRRSRRRQGRPASGSAESGGPTKGELVTGEGTTSGGSSQSQQCNYCTECNVRSSCRGNQSQNVPLSRILRMVSGDVRVGMLRGLGRELSASERERMPLLTLGHLDELRTLQSDTSDDDFREVICSVTARVLEGLVSPTRARSLA